MDYPRKDGQRNGRRDGFFYFPLYFAFFVKDLVGSGSPVMVLMEHNSKNKPKVMQTCSLPITGADCVKKLVTDKGFFKIINGKMTLFDIAEGYTLEDLRNMTDAKFLVADELGTYE